MAEQPYFPFYVDAWRSDEGLTEVSFAARGLWIEMLALMHRAKPRGFFVVSDRRFGLKDTAAIMKHTRGTTVSEVRKLLAELGKAKVFSISEDGTIYNRKMVNDEARRARNAANGARGGNPRLTNSDNPPRLTELSTGSDKANARGVNQTKLDTAAQSGARIREADDVLDDDEIELGGTRPVQRGPAHDLATWFIAAATDSKAMPGHLKGDPTITYREAQFAEPLVAHYDVAEIKRRAQNLFARRLHRTDPLTSPCSFRTLAERWDWFDSPNPPSEKRAAGAVPTTGFPRYEGPGSLE